MKFKYYTNRYQRSKSSNFDRGTILDIKDIEPNKILLNKCKLLKEAALLGEPSAADLYTQCKSNLNCINIHNLGDLTKEEFITTNYLGYDIDNIDTKTVKKLINYSKTICPISMISPSRKGVKLFFKFEDNTITSKNLKLLYNNFGNKIINNINNTLNLQLELDGSSNDLNRLCYIGQIFINDELTDGAYKATSYYTQTELDNYNKTTFQSTTNSVTYTGTLDRIERSLIELEKIDKPVALKRHDLMTWGFSFASILKDGDTTQLQAYLFFKRLMKLGEANKEDENWISKSGSNNKYVLDVEFKTFIQQWGGNGMCAKTGIGSFFHMCKQKGISGNQIVYQNY